MKALHLISHGVFLYMTPKSFHLETYDGKAVSPESIGLTTENNGMSWLLDIFQHQDNYQHLEIIAFNG